MNLRSRSNTLEHTVRQLAEKLGQCARCVVLSADSSSFRKVRSFAFKILVRHAITKNHKMSTTTVRQQNQLGILNASDDNPTRDFVHNIETFINENGYRKDPVVKYIKKHFKENTDYIILHNQSNRPKNYGGHNKHDYYMTEKSYDLLNRSYNINNRYSPHIQAHTIMSLENQTVGFITSCLKDICDCVRSAKYNTTTEASSQWYSFETK